MAFARFQRLALGCLISLGLSVAAHAGTAIRVADFNDGPLFPADVFPEDLVAFRNGFLFSALSADVDGVPGSRQMFFSDGTIDGTRTLVPGLLDARLAARWGPCQLWLGRGLGEPERLWCTELATGASRPLSRAGFRAQILGIEPSRGHLYWVELPVDGGPGEIRRDDGQPGGLGVQSILGVAGDRPIGRAVATRNRFLFALGGNLNFGRLDLFASEGTAATTQPLLEPWSPIGFRITAAGDRAFLLGAPLAQPNRDQLWVTDGTAAGSQRLAFFPAGQINTLVSSGRRLYFLRRTPELQELWTSDGTVAGTRLLTTLPGPTTVFAAGSTATLNERFVFLWDDATRGVEPWVSDGTPGGTQPLRDICPGSCNGVGFNPWALAGGLAYFSGIDGATGVELWATDGTASGTRLVRDVCPGSCSGGESAPFTIDDTVFLYGQDDATGIELWTTHGATAGLRRVSNLERFFPFESASIASPGPAADRTVVRVGNRFWFSAKSTETSQLYVSDGNPSTTRLGLRLGNPVPPGSTPSTVALEGAAVSLVLRADRRYEPVCTYANGNFQLLPLPSTISARPPALPVGPRAYFSGLEQLWITDCNTRRTVPVTSFEAPDRYLYPTPPRRWNGEVVFLVEGLRSYLELWASDGTPAGTRRLADLPEAFRPSSWVVSERGFFFEALSTPYSGFYLLPSPAGELQPILVEADCTGGFVQLREAFDHAGETFLIWSSRRPEDGSIVAHRMARSNGLPTGTSCVPTDVFVPEDPNRPAWVRRNGEVYLTGLPAFSRAASLLKLNAAGGFEAPIETGAQEAMSAPVLFGNRLAFLTGPEPLDTSRATVLRITDGTVDGTTSLPAGIAAGPLSLAAVGNRLYFSGCTATDGCELWESDGTAAGTRRRQELRPGPASSTPGGLFGLGTSLFFTADDGATGREPWVLDLAAGAPACPVASTALCLGGGRFRAEVVWQDFAGNQGLGHAVALTPDSGAFWFFDPANLEAMTKVVDGTGLNDRFWVFYGALTNVRYQLTVTDTSNGNARRWANLSGQFRSFADTDAFPSSGPLTGPADLVLEGASPAPEITSGATRASRAPCVPGPTRLCLLDGRFSAEVTLEDPAVPALAGQAVPWSPDAGFLWFFGPDNLEVGVKMVDGTALNGKFWVFSASLSNLGYRLTVTDTTTNTTRTYRNRPGAFASFADTGAF